MGAENLLVEIEDRELQLMGPEPPRRIARGEPECVAEEQEDVRRLGDGLPAGFENRHRERGARDAARGESREDRRHAAAL